MEALRKSNGLPLDGARVLVVEDDFWLLTELESILQDAGAEVVGLCRTVEEALALADRDGIGAAILDVRIGRHEIAPVARRLAKRGTPFLFYTGQVGDDRMLAEWPECKIVSKPASPQSIVAAVAELLKQ